MDARPTPLTCEHGGMKRKCPICERDETISQLERTNAELVEALRECRGVILFEHNLNSEYGWKEFVTEKIDPALRNAGVDHE